MPAWPGGPCPRCGDDMPENLIHCMSCRELLNTDLHKDSVEIPAFVPLQEIEAIIDLHARGVIVECPKCQEELKINLKYAGEELSCKHCDGRFQFDLDKAPTKPVAYYGDCPHCNQFLRFSLKYVGLKVGCKHCTGKIRIVP